MRPTILLPTLALGGCVLIFDGDDDDSGSFETCDAAVAAIEDELDDLRACTTDAQCGQVLAGTSCGCTRNLVVREDADPTRFWALWDDAVALSCDVGTSPCDCPEAYGFVCDDGQCGWRYVSAYGYLPDCRTAEGDPFQVDDVRVVGDTLELDVAYGGGCETHDFSLCWPDGAFMESSPVQASLEVLHDDHGDACDAWLSETVSLDLVPLKAAYRAAYGGSGTILINVAGEQVAYTL